MTEFWLQLAIAKVENDTKNKKNNASINLEIILKLSISDADKIEIIQVLAKIERASIRRALKR